MTYLVYIHLKPQLQNIMMRNFFALMATTALVQGAKFAQNTDIVQTITVNKKTTPTLPLIHNPPMMTGPIELLHPLPKVVL